MADTLTKEQRLAVENQGGKLLVSAAAGSGKTKVLVDRLMRYILDPVKPANIDDFLIITYTKAAASELRGKIASKLSELIAENPQNNHLQRQMQRLYLAKISTVHGFCGDILRQYAYRLDIPSDFRVADEGECLQIKVKALEQVLNDAYNSTEEDPAFYAFVDSQGLGRDDRQIPQIILKVYNSARCHLNPDSWLDWCVVDCADNIDAAQTTWGKFLVEDLKQFLNLQIDAFNRCTQSCSLIPEMNNVNALFLSTVSQLQTLCDCNKWDDIVSHKNIDFGRLTFPRKCPDLQLAEQMKAVRNVCKRGLAKRTRNFSDISNQVIADLQQTVLATKGLVALVRSFSAEYDRLKKSRGVLDFSDLEHITLDLFLGKNRNTVTTIANEVGDSFCEVMVDEYQDSNEIQDAIFNALTTRRQNCFMVGDVKQSIYQFRLADPGIFIDKYNTYDDAQNAKDGEGRRVLLSHNFRSSGGVISAVNDVFMQCMSAEVGGIDYGKQEMLREGIPHIPLTESEVSLVGIDVQADTYLEEANYVANEICSLLDGTHMVRDGDKLRAIQPDDIAILLRSPGSVGYAFQSALEKHGIRCVTGDATDLLHTEEISTVRAILQIINNPLQDIPLISVLTCPVFGFTADELADLRSENRYSDIYGLISKSGSEKCRFFLQILNQLRDASRFLSVTQLISLVYEKTNLLRIYGAMSDGVLKCNNLQMFFQVASGFEATGPKNLSLFLDFLDASDEKGLAGMSGQQEKGAVTLMSVHKSKGLEFPVVFLCGLSRSFNLESAHAQVLCHKDLGLGLDCTDAGLRVRYPTIAKRAVSTKILRESISEEMRVLYVAMTRARDRLIMTYAKKNLAADLQDIALRLDMCSSKLLASEADCPGWWVLQAALTRTEAGAFFALSGHPDCATVRETQWKISIADIKADYANTETTACDNNPISDEIIQKFVSGLDFTYAYHGATQIPSKLTATQLKGRILDTEVSDGKDIYRNLSFRKPGTNTVSGMSYGSAVHAVLQYINYGACVSVDAVNDEISRLVGEKLITQEQAALVDGDRLFAFFDSPVGKKICSSTNVLREFKFSVLDNAENYYSDIKNEQILLQGVVDLALIDEDGITVLDFKTDNVTEDTLPDVAAKYQAQVLAYANALNRIYQKPIKSAMLYFFATNSFFDVI